MATNIGGIFAKLGLQGAAFQRDMGRAAKAVETNTFKMNQSFRSIDKQTRNVSKSVSQLRVGLVALGGVAAVNKLRESFSSFETSLQRTVGLVGVAQSQVNKFEKAILKLAPAVGKGPGELAEAMFFITSAGLEGQQAMDALTVSAKAAVAGLGETKSVADAVTSAMNAYATSGLTAARATDVMVATVREGKLEASELAGALGQVLAVAESASVRFDEVGASVAALTRVGIQTSQAVTGLRGVLVALAKESAEGTEILNAYGQSYENLRRSIREKGLIDTLIGLRQTIGANETALIKIFGRIEAANTVLALTGANAEQVRGIFLRLENALGSLDRAFGVVFATTQERFNRAIAQLQVSAIGLGATVVPNLAAAVEILAENLRAVTAAIAAIVAFKATVLFGGIAVAVWKYVAAVRAATATTGALNAVMARNPLGLVAVGIAAVVAGYIAFGSSAAQANEAEVSLSAAIADGNRLLGEANALSGEAARLKTQEAIATLETAKAKAEENKQTALANAAVLEGQLARMNAPRGAGATGDTALSDEIRKLGKQTTGAALQNRLEGLRKAAADAGATVESLRAQIKNIINPTVDAAKATQDAAAAAAKAAAAAEKMRKAYADGIKGLKRTVDLLRLQSKGRKAEAAALKRQFEGTDLINRMTKAGIVLTRTQKEEIRGLIQERDKLTKSIKDNTEAEKKRQKAVADALEKDKQLAEERQRIMQQPFLNAIDGIQGAFSSAFENIFDGGVDSFSDLASTIKKVFIKLAAEIATLMVFRPILGNVLGAVGLPGLANQLTGGVSVNNAGGNGLSLSNLPSPGNLFGGGFTEAIDAFGASFGFTNPVVAQGAMLSGAVPGGSVGSLSGASLSGVLGAAGLGAFGGGLLASLTGGSQIGGSIGGGLGAGIGFAVGGPIGAAIGGLGGGLLGGMFGGGKPSVGPNGNTLIENLNGRLQVGPSGADNGASPAATIAIARQLVDGLNNLADQFDLVFRTQPSLGIDDFIRQGNGTSFGFTSAQSFANSLFSRGGITSNDASIQKLLDASGSLDQFTQLAGQIGNVRQNAFAASASLVDFLRAQSLDAGSTLSPADRLVESQRQFGDLLGRVRGGEIGLTGSLQQSAQTLLGFGRQNFASTVDFANIEKFVRSSLLNLSEDFLSDDFTDRLVDAQIEAITQQTQADRENAGEIVDAIELLRREIQLMNQKMDDADRRAA